jgi:hypothetical protein
MPRAPEEREKTRRTVEWLYAASGARTHEEWADALGSRSEQVSDWLRGANEPSAKWLLRMIEIAGGVPVNGTTGDPAELLEQFESLVRRLVPLLRARLREQ